VASIEVALFMGKGMEVLRVGVAIASIEELA
jgi:hypothetical protein